MQMDHHVMLDWAECHLKRAEDASYAFFRDGPYIVSSQYDVERSTPELGEWVYQYWVRKPVAPFPDKITLHLGDAVHAMRVALDYVAFAAVRRASQADPALVPVNERDIAFPIVTDPTKFSAR